MNVGKLKKILEKFADNVEVIIDHDENGWYCLEEVEPSTDDDNKKQFVNLISDNES